MAIFDRFQGLRSAVRSGAPARVLAVFVGGSLNQKVITLLGLSAVCYAVYVIVRDLWTPLLIGVVGALMVMLALRDFERTTSGNPP